MQVSNNTYDLSVDFYPIPKSTPYKEKAPDGLTMLVQVRNRETGNPYKTVINTDITPEFMTVAQHPEVEKGGFTRWGDAVQDPIERLRIGINAVFEPKSPYIQELTKKNLVNPQYRVFDNIAYEESTRRKVKETEGILKQLASKYGFSKQELSKVFLGAFEKAKTALSGLTLP